MNWKEFLKPEWKKVILVIFLFVSSTGLTRFLGDVHNVYRDNVVLNILDYIFMAPFILFTPLDSLIPTVEILAIIGWLEFIALIFYWYILSCLIIWIYNEVKKKK